MTKKMTFTFEQTLIDDLENVARSLGKKKTQVVREALGAYMDDVLKKDAQEQWQRDNAEAIALYNQEVEMQGTFSDDMRSF